jgi:hypothetical protein
MKSIHSWNDLERYGIIPLTGEACGLMYRILFDVTASGKKVLEKCFGTPNLNLPESWNRGSENDPHVGCIMLSHEMLQPLAVFALLESGCNEVFLVNDSIYGIESSDPPTAIDDVKRWSNVEHARRLAYSGTAGDRSIMVHVLILAIAVLLSPIAPRVTLLLLLGYVIEGTMRR